MGFPFLIVHAAELPLEHLQLDPATTDVLRQRGVSRVADLIETVGNERQLTREWEMALKALEDLAHACEPKGIDWYRYWKMRDFEFHHMRLTCSELDGLVQGPADFSVSRANFGNAGAMLGRAGYDTITKLYEGLKAGIGDVPGFGAKKQDEFFRHLMQLVRDLRKNKVSSEELAEKFPISAGTTCAEPTSPKYVLHDRVLRLGIGVLHAGAKTRSLETAGYKTVGDVVSVGSETLLALPGMGKSTLAKIQRAFDGLSKAQTSSGSIDWDEYCLFLNIPLLPAERMVMDGNSFAAMVATTIGLLGRTLEDPVLQKIISDRISRQPNMRATLEEIASSLSVPVTRERIRQREAKLLEALAAALVDDDYSQIDVHFRPEFASYWKRAAEHFSDAGEDVTISALVDGLTSTWGADRDVLYENLPLIATVITGEVMSGMSYGDAAKLDARLVSLPDSTKAIPLGRLQIGRSARALRRHGIDTIGDLVEKILRGGVSRSTGAHYRTAIDNLETVADSLDPDQDIVWSKYLEITQTQSLPKQSAQNAADFFRCLPANVSDLLQANPPRMRSRPIFVLRTARPTATRMTLDQIASVLKTHGPSVKMEETDTLVYLNLVLLQGDHSFAGIHLKPEFARMWTLINSAFDDTNGDAELFQRYLASTFGISETEVEPAMPTMIAVLTGYPYGRLGRYTRMENAVLSAGEEPEIEEPQSEPILPARIKLKGFRRAH